MESEARGGTDPAAGKRMTKRETPLRRGCSMTDINAFSDGNQHGYDWGWRVGLKAAYATISMLPTSPERDAARTVVRELLNGRTRKQAVTRATGGR